MKDPNLYQVAFESKVHNCKFYVPATDTSYHISRYLAAGAQNIFSGAGATREVLEAISNRVLEICNADKKQADTWRSDISTLMNNIKYRLQYPIDELCAIRMGAIYCFMEDEDPNETHDVHTRKKLAMAKGDELNGTKADPDLYTFFLSMGVQSTESWKGYEAALEGTDYFQNRQETLTSLTPQPTL